MPEERDLQANPLNPETENPFTSWSDVADQVRPHLTGEADAKLATIQEGATANAPDATLLNRNNHQGSQPASSISDLPEAVQDVLANMLEFGSGLVGVYNDATGKFSISLTGAPAAPASFAVDWHDVRDVPWGYGELNGVTGGFGYSVVTVTSASGGTGAGTLYDALHGAKSNRIVKFAPALAGQTITLSQTVESNGDNITLDGVESGIKIRSNCLRFTGTNIIVSGVEFGPPGVGNDSITFRRNSAPTTDQLFAVIGCTFGAAPASAESSDSCIDIIWKRNRNTRGTIAGCLFQIADRACLINAGPDDFGGGMSLEGGNTVEPWGNANGAYYVTFARNRLTRLQQRFPLFRDGHIHIYNELVDHWGSATGSTTPVRMADVLAPPVGFIGGVLAENCIAFPNKVGDLDYAGAAATNPAKAWFSPSSGNNGTPNMKAVGTYLKTNNGIVPTQTEIDPTAVFTPPYSHSNQTALAPANDALQTFLETVVGSATQKASPLTGYKVPGASHGVIAQGQTVTAKIQGDTPTSVVCMFGGTTVATLTHQGAGIWTGVVTSAIANPGVIGQVKMRATSGSTVIDSPEYPTLVLPDL